jgi:type IV pilus assembly protein PilQ
MKLEAVRAKEKLEDLVMELVTVNYATAKEIIPQVKTVLSERGDVKVDERTNILIIKDIPRHVMGAKSLIKSLDTKTPQVLIEARILEANMTFQRELGVTWGFQVVSGKDTSNKGTVQGGIGSTTTGVNNALIDLPAIARSGAGTAIGTSGIIEFIFNSVHGLRELDIAVSAHENTGDVRVISAPKIATLDNKEASIEQGLRIPYLKLTTEGTVTTDFIDANLKLTVTPHVTNEGNIKMFLKVKKDAPDNTITVQGVPSIDKKEAITEVLVRDNGVMVISGIYQITKNDGHEGVPIFNRIPLLGWLFKREAKEDARKDLLIFISPKIIKDQV